MKTIGIGLMVAGVAAVFTGIVVTGVKVTKRDYLTNPFKDDVFFVLVGGMIAILLGVIMLVAEGG